MKTVVNKTHAPLKVPLPYGKSLRLGPNKTGQIADSAAEHPALKKLIEAKKIEVFDGGTTSKGAGGDGSARHEVTHGHAQSGIRKSGDR
jgi:hypothetical protein